MFIAVNLNGGQGFLPDCCKNNKAISEAFAQDILDRYGSTEYIDNDVIEYYIVQTWYWRLIHWLRAFPFYKNKD